MVFSRHYDNVFVHRSQLAPAIMCVTRHGCNRFPAQNAALQLQQYTVHTLEVTSYIFGDFTADG